MELQSKRIAAALMAAAIESVSAKGLNGVQVGGLGGGQQAEDHADEFVAITLMIAESRPEEKETMVKLVMNFLES